MAFAPDVTTYSDDGRTWRVEDGETGRFRAAGFHCTKCDAPITAYGQGDTTCGKCGQLHNLFGQAIAYPHGRGFDYAGERWDDDHEDAPGIMRVADVDDV